MKLSIIIPCYNESENIPKLIKNIEDAYKPNTEIILVDNGSTDNTSSVLSKELELANNSSIRTKRLETNIGYGHGIMAGVRAAKGEIISWTHADLQTDIKDVYNSFDTFNIQPNQEKIFLKGKRKNRRILDYFLTCGMSIVSSIMLKERLYDINAQPKMFHRNFINLIENAPNDFSIDLHFYYIAVKNKLKIIEIPVYFKNRLHGIAKGGGGSNIWIRIKIIKRTLKFILNLSKR